MKKSLIILMLTILGSSSIWAGYWCTSSPSNCNATAKVYVPSGGSCLAISGETMASVVAYDASGAVVGTDRVSCPYLDC